MEFTQYNCPVCNQQFESGEDIVVCPECGAPHHRGCYEELGHCFYQDKHSESFSFEQLFPEASRSSFEDFETILCPVCFHKNPKGTLTCTRCGTDLRQENVQSHQHQTQNQARSQYQQSQQSTPPFGFGATGIPNFDDPLAGVDSNEYVGDGVTAGEAAKFTGKNTGYFSLLFQRIHKTDRSKFGFAAFIFSGIYFLYRKMYGIGILFTLLIIATNILSTVIMMTPEWSQGVREIANLNYTEVANNPAYASSLFVKSLYVYLPLLLNGVRYVLMIISGLTANRLYYRHSMKTIQRVKQENPDATADVLNSKLEQKGGVNLPLAISFGIASVAVSYICNFFIVI
ncbi:MAG: DUF2628 domain-containing protein [Ruminococcus sp.]|nr:DUF2628 domain-containing protein [Ruminococcus sp.]